MCNSKLYLAVQRALIASGFAVLGLAALPVIGHWTDLAQLGGQALAQEEGGHTGGHTGGGHGGGGPSSGRGQGHGGEEEEDHGDDHGEGHSSQGKRHGQGEGGARGGAHGSDADGRGGHGGQVPGSERGSGGRPPWAKEGIPEVELGRLNVSRAPSHVLARALNEAINEYDPAMSSFYGMTAEAAAALLASDYQNVSRIDSPLQNLSLYKELLSSGSSPLPGVTPSSSLDMAAIFLGSASDKNIPVSTDTVTAVNTILGLTPLSPADTQTLADKAETVRSGISTGHGE